MTVLVRHDTGCPVRSGHSDAAKRVADTNNLHRMAGDYNIGKWFASALADGSTDGTVYETKSQAIAHQHHNENFYTFICISPGGMSVCAAEVMLKVARRLYDAGLRMTDPEVARRDPIKRPDWDNMNRLAEGLRTRFLSGGSPN